MRAVNGERHQGHSSGNYRVPIQNPRIGPRTPIGPQGKKEITFLIQRHAANHIAQGSAVEDRQQQAGKRKAAIEKPAPHRGFQVHAQLNADPAQDQQPQHDHQRKIKAAEA